MEAYLPPVLYLDLDDTIVSWADERPRAAPGARDFVLWALDHYELRWLTTWCPTGDMAEELLEDLCSMLSIAPDVLQHIRGFDWESSESKLNGIAWLEHVVLGRPFLWLEDDFGIGERERSFLARHDLLGSYRCCNVTRDPQALRAIHADLIREMAGARDEAA